MKKTLIFAAIFTIIVLFGVQSFGQVSISPNSGNVLKGSSRLFQVSGGPVVPDDERLQGDAGIPWIESWSASNASLSLGTQPNERVATFIDVGVAYIDVWVAVNTKNGKVSVPASAMMNVVDKEVATIKITPDSDVTKVGGSSLIYYAIGYDIDGIIVGYVEATWVINNGDIGSISGGVFNPSATTPGGGTITATYAKNGASDTASVTVFEVQSISVAPVTANLTSGQTQNFSATVLDESSVNRTSLVSGEISWSADSVLGSLSPTTGSASTLTAGQVDASGKVTASIDGKSGEANVTVVAPETFTININNTAAKDDDNIGVGENIPITIVSSNPKSSKTVVIKSNNMQKAYFGNQSASASITLSQGSGTVSIYGGQTASSAKDDVNIFIVGSDGQSHLTDAHLTVIKMGGVSCGQNILFADGQYLTVISAVIKNPAVENISVQHKAENKSNLGTSIGLVSPFESTTSDSGVAQTVYTSGTSTWHDNIDCKAKGATSVNTIVVYNYQYANIHDFSAIESKYNDANFVENRSATILQPKIEAFLGLIGSPLYGKKYYSSIIDFKGTLCSQIIAEACSVNHVSPKFVCATIQKESNLIENPEAIGNFNYPMNSPKKGDFRDDINEGINILKVNFDAAQALGLPFRIDDTRFRWGVPINYTSSQYKVYFYVYNCVTAIQYKFNPDIATDKVEGDPKGNDSGPCRVPIIYKRQLPTWIAIGE